MSITKLQKQCFIALLITFRPLQRMVVGMILAGLAFVVAGFVQLKVQSSEETLKPGQSKLVVYNTAPFVVDYQLEGSDGFTDNRTMNYSDVSLDIYHTSKV